MLLWTGEAGGVGQLSGGYVQRRATTPTTFGKPTAWTGVERRGPQPVQQERPPAYRVRASRGAVLLLVVAIELAWLVVLGYAAHRLFLQSPLQY